MTARRVPGPIWQHPRTKGSQGLDSARVQNREAEGARFPQSHKKSRKPKSPGGCPIVQPPSHSPQRLHSPDSASGPSSALVSGAPSVDQPEGTTAPSDPSDLNNPPPAAPFCAKVSPSGPPGVIRGKKLLPRSTTSASSEPKPTASLSLVYHKHQPPTDASLGSSSLWTPPPGQKCPSAPRCLA